MTDREQIRRDAERLIGKAGDEGDIAWFCEEIRDDGSGSKEATEYYEFLSRCFTVIRSLLAELEQAERELEDWKRIGQSEAFKALGLRSRADEAEQGVEYALACIAEWQQRAERAEHERDEFKAIAASENRHATENAEAWDRCEERLAKVPALVEALREIAAHGDDTTAPENCYLPMIGAARRALADWEQDA